MKGEVRTTGGLVTELVRKHTKKGDVMATFVWKPRVLPSNRSVPQGL